MSATIFEQVREMAADLFDVSQDRITPQSSPENIEGWDSLQHLNLMLAVEERFDLRFDPEEIDQMRTIQRITTLVETKLHHRKGGGLPPVPFSRLSHLSE